MHCGPDDHPTVVLCPAIFFWRKPFLKITVTNVCNVPKHCFEATARGQRPRLKEGRGIGGWTDCHCGEAFWSTVTCLPCPPGPRWPAVLLCSSLPCGRSAAQRRHEGMATSDCWHHPTPLHLATTDCGEVVNPETPLVLLGLLCARGTYCTQKEFSRVHTKLWRLIY